MNVEEIEAIVGGYHGDPFRVLGPHRVRKKGGQARWEVRAFLPQAESAEVLARAEGCPMEKQHEQGFFCVSLAGEPRALHHPRQTLGRPRPSRSTTRTASGRRSPIPTSTCTPKAPSTRPTARSARTSLETEGATGVRFAVWAPNALNVTVTGEFNDWDTRRHPMRRRNGGVWELFVPGLGEGAPYKYNVRSRFAGYQQLKADPYAFYCEAPPKSASVVWNFDEYQWSDAAWMEARAAHRHG